MDTKITIKRGLKTWDFAQGVLKQYAGHILTDKANDYIELYIYSNIKIVFTNNLYIIGNNRIEKDYILDLEAI